MMSNIIDASGRSCPEPVLLTKNAIASKEKRYEVLVDNQTAVQNVTRFAINAGYTVDVKEEDENYCLILTSQ